MGETSGREAAPPRTAGEMLARGRDFLTRKGLERARLEAELLVAHALGLDRLRLFLALDRPVSADEVARARELLVRRGKREPTAYITGTREFYGRPFAVSPSVLVPRPETELMVDLGRERLRGREAPRVADVGTGSGCLAITLALEHPSARVRAVDLSAAALEQARANAAALGAAVEWVEGDGPEAIADGQPYELVVSNPPYVRPEELAGLEPEVRDWEPRSALLLPETDPEHWLRRLLRAGLDLLAPDGALLVELGADQGERALVLAGKLGLPARLHADLAGVQRVLEASPAPSLRASS
jgi:release factor glutamine methyltransferase